MITIGSVSELDKRVPAPAPDSPRVDMSVERFLVPMTRCRQWVINARTRVGRCGECGQVPSFT